MKHLYLFTLEIVPLKVGKAYDELPSHLTLMSRFLSELSPDRLASHVQHVFVQTDPVILTIGRVEGLGPKKVAAHMVSSPSEMALHNELHKNLSALGVAFQYPQFIGMNHRAHVSVREGVMLREGQRHVSLVVYLIEVVDKKRVVRAKFEF